MSYGKNTEEQTDTHLAKRYNDVLFDCIMRCNLSAYVNEATPHYDNLLGYIAAVDTLFINTFFLFEQTPVGKDLTLTTMLINTMKGITDNKNAMKYSSAYRTQAQYKKVAEKCRDVHMMIMFGLQKRKMLVRMSEREPRGSESINYWDTKAGFEKGAIPYNLPKAKKWK